MPAANDREFNLQRLAFDNARLAHMELKLIETIQMNQRKLAELPEIIRRLEEQHRQVTAEMNRTGAEHDALEAWVDDCPYPCDGCEAVLGRGENCPSYVNAAEFRTYVDDAEFRIQANDMADDYADHKLTVQPPVGW